VSVAASRDSSALLRDVVVGGEALVLSRPRVGMRAEVVNADAGTAPALEKLIAQAREEGVADGRALEARTTREEMETAIEAARSQAGREGFQEGFAEGRQEAAEQAELSAAKVESERRAHLSRLDEILSSATQEVDRWRQDSEDDIVALAHEIALRVLGDHATKPDVLREMTRHVLREHGARKSLAVHVHPEDLEQLTADGEDVPWEWVGDSAVDSGVSLRSPQGNLDARLSTQLRALTETLAEHRRSRRLLGGTKEHTA
jgi:flagellar biosynthesis/type III secretory pathway protein FliH